MVKEKLIQATMEVLKRSVVNFLKWLAIGIANQSYWICLTACFIALFLYIAGEKRAGKYVSISFVIFVILQVIKGAFL